MQPSTQVLWPYGDLFSSVPSTTFFCRSSVKMYKSLLALHLFSLELWLLFWITTEHSKVSK